MIDKLKHTLGKSLIKMQVNRRNLPSFEESKPIRVNAIFTGDVQGVGFRYEAAAVARRLGLTGWVRNLEDSSVESELQGERDKVEYFLEFIKTHPRIRVDGVKLKELSLLDNETEYEIER